MLLPSSFVPDAYYRLSVYEHHCKDTELVKRELEFNNLYSSCELEIICGARFQIADEKAPHALNKK